MTVFINFPKEMYTLRTKSEENNKFSYFIELIIMQFQKCQIRLFQRVSYGRHKQTKLLCYQLTEL